MKHRQLLRTAIAFMLAVMMTSLPAKAGKKFPSGYGVYEYDLTASVTIEVGEEKEIDPAKLNETFYQILNNKASDGYYYHWDAYAAKISVGEYYYNVKGEPNLFCATEIKEKQGDLIPGDKDGARYWFDTGCTIIGLNPGTSHITYEVCHYSHYASLSNNSREKVLSRLKVYVTVKESGKTQLTLTPSNTNKFVNKGTAITFSPNVSGATVYCCPDASLYFKSENKRRSVTIEKTSYVTAVAVKRGYTTSELFEHTYYVEDGIFFNSNTPEGVLIQYKVTDETNNTCEVAYVPETATGTVTIPEEVKGFTVTGIKAQAFKNCSMDNLILPKTITVIGDSAFMGSKISSFTIPSHIQSIGKYAFARSALESITIPGSVETIEKKAFYDCGLVSLNILEGVTNIGEYAFDNCTQLKTLNLPNTLKTIQEGAFNGCGALNEIVIPHSVSCIGEYNQEIKGKTNVEIIPVSA